MPNDVVLFRADQKNRQYFQPDPAAPRAERDPAWYVDNIKYICTYYDRWYNTILTSQMGASVGNPAPSNTSSSIDNQVWGVPNETPVQRMIRMMTYYNGWQPNMDYNHLTKNITTSNLMPSWIRSQKVYSINNVLSDTMSQMMANADFDVEDLSEGNQNKKKLMLDKLMVEFEMRDMIEEIAKLGLAIDSSGGKQFQMKEEIEEHIEQLRDMDSQLMIKIARSIWMEHDFTTKIGQLFRHANTAGRCGIEHTVYNGKYKPNLWMPYELIVDNRRDDDYNRYATFVGVIKYYTPEQIFLLYPQMLKHKKDVEDMAKESSLGFPYNTMSNLTWWYYAGAQQRGMVACVTGYWKTIKDTSIKRYKDNFNVDRLRNAQPGELGDDLIEDVSCGTLIGNRYLTCYGERNNIIENFYDKSKVELPIKIFMPNMNLGESPSVTSRISDLVNERDAMRFKIREMIGKAKGKVYVIKGWKFGNGVNERTMEQNFSTLGFHVLTGGGEIEDLKSDDGSVIEQIDMTLDPNVIRLQDVIMQIDLEIQEVAKVTSAAMGNDQVQKYMGVGVQANVLQQGSGNSTIYTNFANWVQMNVQYAATLCAYLFTEDEDAVQVIGKNGLEYLRLGKEIRYTNPLVYLKIAPFIDGQQRQRLLNIADRMAAAEKIDMLDYLDIEMAKNIPELAQKLRYGIKKKQAADEHEKAMLEMLQQISQQNQQLAQQVQMLSGEQGQNIRQAQQLAHEQGMAAMQQASAPAA